MMRNDRRAIANELRRVSNDSLNGESLQRALARIAGAEDSSWRGVMRRIADLIDPTTTCNIYRDGNSFICEKCGGEWPKDVWFEYCPYCGVEVIDD